MASNTSFQRKKPSIIRRAVSPFLPRDRGQVWENLARTLTAAAGLCVPLVVAPWSNDSWELQKTVLLLVLVALAWAAHLVTVIVRGHDRWQWGALDVLVLGYGAVVSVSTVLSLNWWASLFGVAGWTSHSLITTWSFIGLHFLVAKLFRSSSERQLLWISVLVGIFLSLVAQMFQLAGLSLLPSPLDRNAWFSTIGNLNLSVVVVVALFGAAVLVLWNARMEKWVKALLILGTMFSWALLLFSGRALGWAVFALGMVLVVLHQSRDEKRVNFRLVLAAVILAGLGLMMQLTNVARHSGLPKLNELTLDQATTAKTTFSALAHRPILGTGPSTWYEAFVKYRPTSFNASAVWDIRFYQGGSGWMQLLATTGILGVVGFLAIVFLGIRQAFRLWKETGDSFVAVSGFTLVVILVSGFFTIWPLVLMTIAWIGLGSIRATANERIEIKTARFPAWGYAAAAFVTVATAVAALPMAGVYASDVLTNRAVTKASKNAPFDEILGVLKRAQVANPRNPDAVKYLLNGYASQITQAVQTQKTTEGAAAVKDLNTLMSDSIKIMGRDPQLYEAHNQALNNLSGILPDAVTQAKQNFETLQRLEPANPIHDVGFGQTTMTILGQQTQGNASVSDAQKQSSIASAIAAYDAAISKKAGYFQAMLSKMQALVDVGQADQALAVFGDLNLLTPTERSYVRIVRAQAFDAKKKPGDAAAEIVAIMEELPNDPSVYPVAADYYVKAGKKADAKKILDQGARLFPNDQSIKDKLKEVTK